MCDAIAVRQIDQAHRQDILLPNHPFPLFGRLLPSYADGRWSWREELWPPEKTGEMCFPEDRYDLEDLTSDTIFLGAYQGERCVGLAVLKPGFFAYMYLENLKVDRAFRRRGVGSLLVSRALEVSLANGYRGLYLQAQDNNLAACRFYLKQGFQIGGLDTRVYRGTSQEGKSDITFYQDA